MNVLEYTRLALAHGANPFYTKYLAGRRVLDIGAGEGDFVARDPARFVGIDIEPRLVEHCRTRGLDVRAMSALRLEFPDQSFEAIHAAQVIEHFDANDAAAFLQEASRVLMPGGVIVLTTPGVRNVWDTFSHVRPYTPTALRKFLPARPKATFVMAASRWFSRERGDSALCRQQDVVLPAWLGGFRFQAAQSHRLDDHLKEKNHVTPLAHAVTASL